MNRIAIVLLLLSSVALAQDPAESRVDSVFARFNFNTPGCALAVVRDGRIIYEKGYGQASLELGVPITPRTVFDIGSTSKQFTATSILLLAQQGKLSLDDDIRKFIPEIPDYGKPVTLRHMLHHISGIRDYIGLLELAGAQEEAVTGDADALAIIAKQRGLNYSPGDDYLYSNSNFFLLSVVVKRITGKPLREFEQENIFVPLGMNGTQVLDDHTRVIPGKAESYSPRRDGHGAFALDIANWEQTGDGAIQTTVEDLARWDDNFYHPKVGGESLLSELQTPGVLNNGSKITYALGLNVDTYHGLHRVSHGGAWAGFRAELMRFPEQHFSAIVLCNEADSNPASLAERVSEIYLADKMTSSAAPAPNPTAASLDPKRFAGTYYSSGMMEIRSFSARDGKLYLGPNTELIPLGGDDFATVSGTRVHFDDAGATITPTSGLPESLARVPEMRFDAAALRAYTGSFVSEELGVTWRLVADGGKLTFIAPDALRLADEPHELTAVTKDIFRFGGLVLRFERSGDAVQGFVIGAGRMRGIKFERQEH